MSSLAAVLFSEGPLADLAEELMLYGQFVGEWVGTMEVVGSNDERRKSSCEVHFGWVLGGRAVQDVWLAPSREDRASNDSSRGLFGTTVRMYDPRARFWKINWMNPVDGSQVRLLGRRLGDRIVQEYRADDGALCQWVFSDISKSAFRWMARSTRNEGHTWTVQAECHLTRKP